MGERGNEGGGAARGTARGRGGDGDGWTKVTVQHSSCTSC